MNKNNDKYYRTANFYQASFLFAKGMELVSIDRTTPQKCVFVFVDNPLRELFVRAFSLGKEDDPEVMVDSRKLIQAIKTIKENLYQD